MASEAEDTKSHDKWQRPSKTQEKAREEAVEYPIVSLAKGQVGYDPVRLDQVRQQSLPKYHKEVLWYSPSPSQGPG